MLELKNMFQWKYVILLEVQQMGGKTKLAWFQGAFPQGNTCLSRLSLLLCTLKKECRVNQAFFVKTAWVSIHV